MILRHAQPVVSSLARYPAVSAGFVIISRDFPNGSSPQNCPVVTLISVRLPGLQSSVFTVPVRFNACNVPPPVAVSVIISRSLLFETVGAGIATTTT